MGTMSRQMHVERSDDVAVLAELALLIGATAGGATGTPRPCERRARCRIWAPTPLRSPVEPQRMG